VTPPLQENVPLAPFTTLGIGGPARYFIRARSESTVAESANLARSKGLPLFVLGGGSNLLIADDGFPGLVLKMEIQGMSWIDDGTHIRLTAGAGEDWDQVVAGSIARDLSGFECLSGIPGSVGGTPVQNVGAYGQEISDTLCELQAYDGQSARIVNIPHDECHFAYRSSVFNTSAKGRYIVLAVSYRLAKHGRPAIRYPELQREFENKTEPSLAAVRDVVRKIRARKAMLLQPGEPDSQSAGSFFKNPVLSSEAFARLEVVAGEKVPGYPAPDGNVKAAAAWLIEHAGIAKGYSLGPAAVSGKHTLALVNKGGATASDMISLAREIQRRVRDRFGLELAPEPVFIGFSEYPLEIKS